VETILLVQFISGLLGFLAILIGAFGAHRLRKHFDLQQQMQFDTGVKFQLFHAILLVVLGFNLGFTTSFESYMAYAFILGTVLFSFSIYGLTWTSAKGKKAKWLVPLTPVGGLLLLTGWAMLIYYSVAFIL